MLLLDIIIICLGFVGLIWGADKFVFGASALAHNAGASPLVIGLTIVAFGTSAPEIFSAVASALADEPELAIGNAVGSNIFNVGIALGAATAIKPLKPHISLRTRELPAMLVVTLLTGLLLADFHLGIVDGLILILVTIAFGWYLAKRKSTAEIEEELADAQPDTLGSLKAAAYLLFGLGLLILSAEALVDSATSVAVSLGVSSGVIGLTLVALGTSLPELAASVTCALRGHHDLAIGNIVGSNIMNLLVVLPFPGILSPSTVDSSLLYRDYVTMTALTLLLAGICYHVTAHQRSISRLSGFLFLAIYAGWVTVMYWQL